MRRHIELLRDIALKEVCGGVGATPFLLTQGIWRGYFLPTCRGGGRVTVNGQFGSNFGHGSGTPANTITHGVF